MTIIQKIVLVITLAFSSKTFAEDTTVYTVVKYTGVGLMAVGASQVFTLDCISWCTSDGPSRRSKNEGSKMLGVGLLLYVSGKILEPGKTEKSANALKIRMAPDLENPGGLVRLSKNF